MESGSSNGTGDCVFQDDVLWTFALIDILTFLLGQPVVAKLLWLVVTSKKSIDILNCNLALFHNLQYLISILHMSFLLLWSSEHLKVVRFLLVYVQTGGPMSLTFICLERFFAVIFPTSYPLLKKYRFRAACVFCVWFMSPATALANVFVDSSGLLLSESNIKSIPLSVMISMGAIMVWCSFKIASELKKSGPGRDKLHPIKKRALKTVLLTSFITVCCYIPVASLQKANIGSESTYNCVVTPLCIMFLSAASIVHPVFYLSTQKKLCPCSTSSKRGTKTS